MEMIGEYLNMENLTVSKKSGGLVYFTGLPCSGKTTIANKIKEIIGNTRRVEFFDGDIFRKTLCKDLGYTNEDRKKSSERIMFVISYLVKHGVLVFFTAITPQRKLRKEVRDQFENFIQVYVDADSQTCAKRDVKGMWKKAINGELENFAGVNLEYEVPTDSEIICHSSKETIEECANKVISYLKTKGFLNA